MWKFSLASLACYTLWQLLLTAAKRFGGDVRIVQVVNAAGAFVAAAVVCALARRDLLAVGAGPRLGLTLAALAGIVGTIGTILLLRAVESAPDRAPIAFLVTSLYPFVGFVLSAALQGEWRWHRAAGVALALAAVIVFYRGDLASPR